MSLIFKYEPIEIPFYPLELYMLDVVRISIDRYRINDNKRKQNEASIVTFTSKVTTNDLDEIVNRIIPVILESKSKYLAGLDLDELDKFYFNGVKKFILLTQSLR